MREEKIKTMRSAWSLHPSISLNNAIIFFYILTIFTSLEKQQKIGLKVHEPSLKIQSKPTLYSVFSVFFK